MDRSGDRSGLRACQYGSVAGFTGGTAFKVGSNFPYARVQRYFVRQTIDLGGETQKVAADLNQLAVFDTNKYAQNPRQDFLNWALTDAGSFDYASDARGYTYGASLEWYATVDAESPEVRGSDAMLDGLARAYGGASL